MAISQMASISAKCFSNSSKSWEGGKSMRKMSNPRRISASVTPNYNNNNTSVGP